MKQKEWEDNMSNEKYQTLGQSIIEFIYDELYFDGIKNYKKLKDDLNKFHINNSIYVDKNFTMHEYNHGNVALPDSCRYRWENVLDFYVRQHIKAGLLDEINGDIALTTTSQKKILEDHTRSDKFFDLARIILRQQYEDKKNGR